MEQSEQRQAFDAQMTRFIEGLIRKKSPAVRFLRYEGPGVEYFEDLFGNRYPVTWSDPSELSEIDRERRMKVVRDWEQRQERQAQA